MTSSPRLAGEYHERICDNVNKLNVMVDYERGFAHCPHKSLNCLCENYSIFDINERRRLIKAVDLRVLKESSNNGDFLKFATAQILQLFFEQFVQI